MARIEAVERIAHAMVCDNTTCDVMVPMRGPTSKPTGYYVDLARVTDQNVWRKTPETLFFHNKDCMIDALQYQFSALTDERVFDVEHPKPRSHPS